MMLRLLADENISADVVDALRQDGHDVAWIRAESPGIDVRHYPCSLAFDIGR